MSYDPRRSLHRTLEDAAAHISRGEIDDALCAAGHALDHARAAGWPEISMNAAARPNTETGSGT